MGALLKTCYFVGVAGFWGASSLAAGTQEVYIHYLILDLIILSVLVDHFALSLAFMILFPVHATQGLKLETRGSNTIPLQLSVIILSTW